MMTPAPEFPGGPGGTEAEQIMRIVQKMQSHCHGECLSNSVAPLMPGKLKNMTHEEDDS